MEEFIFDDDVDEVGAEVEAHCPKCKADTQHVVVSKYEDEIRRVQCNPCGDVHPYRKPRGESDEEEPTPAQKKKAAKAKPTWDQVMAKAKKQPRLYVVAEQYKENELLSHPKFGVGFVSEVIGLDKIEVTFQAEKRVLIHNRQGMSLPPAAYTHMVDNTVQDVKKGKGGKPNGKAAPAKVEASAPAKAPDVKAAKGGKVAAPEKGKPAVAAKAPEKKAAPKAPEKKPAAKKPVAKPVAKKPAAKPVAKKPAAKQAAKKPAAKQAAKKPVAKKPVAKPAAKKAAAKKPAAKKPVAKKPVAKKPVAKKAPAKKPAAKKPAPKKPAAKKPPAKKKR